MVDHPSSPERSDTSRPALTTVDTIATIATNASVRRAEQRRKHQEKREREAQRAEATQKLLVENENAIIDNPLVHLTERELRERIEDRFRRWRFGQYELDIELFQRAGRVAQKPDHYESLRLLPDEERTFRLEKDATFWDETHIRVPIALCCLAAVVQGWTQSSANAANLYYPKALGMTAGPDSNELAEDQRWLFSIQNAALFISGALAGCWLSDPLNEWFYGRRGAMFIAALFTVTAVIGCAFAQTKEELLVFRIILGLGMGAKASVVPVYAAEIAPAKMRGRLVINWQVFTALGIFLAFTVNLVFATDEVNGWRIMFGSGIVPTLMFITLVLVCPESPRFLMKRGLYIEAYNSFLALRGSPIAAAREMIYLDAQLQATEAQLIRKRKKKPSRRNPEAGSVPMTPMPLSPTSFDDFDDWDSDGDTASANRNGNEKAHYDGPRGFKQRVRAWWTRTWVGGAAAGEHGARDPFVLQFRNTNYIARIWNLLSHPRNARASLAAATVMIAQQLCGINILAFYSTSLFQSHTELTTSLTPLWYSWGFGLTNFLFSFPAYFLVDQKGRRWLLLWTFPPMAVCLLITGFLYDGAAGASYAFIIIFTAFYSFGGGPIPFAYSAEVYPLTIREAGMSFAIFWNFLGAALLLLLVPQLLPTPKVLLGVFTGLCMLAWVCIFLFMPETKRRNLEEINYIFGVPTLRHCRYQLFEVAPYEFDQLVGRWIFPKRERVKKPFPLYRWYDPHRAGGNQPVA